MLPILLLLATFAILFSTHWSTNNNKQVRYIKGTDEHAPKCLGYPATLKPLSCHILVFNKNVIRLRSNNCRNMSEKMHSQMLNLKKELTNFTRFCLDSL